MPEAWLRGPVDGVPDPLQPAAHSLIDAVEDMEGAVVGLGAPELWLRPGGVASIGFHLRHVAGSTLRLLTYARGEALTPEQLEAVGREGEVPDPPTGAEELLASLSAVKDQALDAYRATDPRGLSDPRFVGRQRLPSTVQGLLFHAAEHARRHAGQVIATAGIIRGLRTTDLLGEAVGTHADLAGAVAGLPTGRQGTPAGAPADLAGAVDELPAGPAGSAAEAPSDLAARVREACLEAALRAYEDAGIRGLCAEGRWETAVGALQRVDLADL